MKIRTISIHECMGVYCCYTQADEKFQKRDTASSATQSVCVRPKAAAHIGYMV